MSKINFLALGGLNEKNKNMYILEIDSKIFVLDSGINEPLNTNFGIQSYIPKIDYLLEHRDKVKGIFLSSPNRQQIGTIIQLFKKIPNIKIYGSYLTIKSLGIFFSKVNFSKNLKILNPNEEILINGIKILPIELNSSLPGNYGYSFNSKDGNIIYFTDYIFDSIEEYKVPLINIFKAISNKDNLLFLSDSLNMEIENSISPNYRVTKYIKNHFYKSKRMICFMYEDDLINVFELIKLGIEFKKKIFVYDDEILNLLNEAYKFTNLDKKTLHKASSFSENDWKNSLILFTGTRTNLYSKINSILLEESKSKLRVLKEDIVFLAANPQIGNEHYFQEITNYISRIDPELVITPEDKYSVHPSQFDFKNFLKIINPKYFIPIKGFYKELLVAANIAKETGMDKENIFILNNGDKILFEDGKFVPNIEKLSLIGEEVIEGLNDSIIESKVVDERQKLGKDGLLTIAVLVYLKAKTYQIVSNIDIQMRGVIYIRNQGHLIEKIEKIVVEMIEENEEFVQLNKIISNINRNVTKVLKTEIKKIPEIIIKIKQI